MSSKLVIFNKALLACGQSGLLTSDTGATPQHAALNLHFDGVVGEVLATRPWSFAQRYATLRANVWDAQDPASGFDTEESWAAYYKPAGEWAHSITLPDDYVGYPRICWVTRTPRAEQRVPFLVVKMHVPEVVEVRSAKNIHLLYCDQDEVTLRYTSSSVPPEAYDPQFEMCVVHLLASRIAVAVGAGPNIMNSNLQLYQSALPDAHVFSLNEAQDDPEPDGSLLSGRC